MLKLTNVLLFRPHGRCLVQVGDRVHFKSLALILALGLTACAPPASVATSHIDHSNANTSHQPSSARGPYAVLPPPAAVHAAPLVAPAAQPEPAPLVIHPDHPRLIVGGYRGVSLDILRAACDAPEMRGECARIGGKHMLDDAMAWLLHEDDAAAGRVASALRNIPGCGDGYERTAIGGYALAFDWVYETLPESERRRISLELGACGARFASENGLRGNGPHLWHGYTSQAAALALVALAVDDSFAGRAALLEDARALFRGNALEAWALTGGAWPEGYNYERSHLFSGDPPSQYVLDALRAWDSAVERDHPEHASLFDTIAEEEGDWLRGVGYHVLYGTLDAYGEDGKRTLMRGGDLPTGQAWPNKQYRPWVDAIARIYAEPRLKAWGRALDEDWSFVGGSGTYHSIHRYSLPFNLPIGEHTGPQRPPLPLSRIWGREDLGYVLMRSSWDEGATTVGYRAGKWLTGHQHMDQGHIDIWRKGPLAVDAGVYANWGSEHREAFYIRSVAHNTILVHRDGEDFDEHPGYGEDVNDGGQRVHTFTRAGCSQCMQSVAEWRSHVGDGMHFEAAEIEAYAHDSGLTWIASDLTGAYNSTRFSTPGNEPKVEVVQRDLAYLHPGWLVVLDRVRTTAGSGPPRFVLHLPARPEIEGLEVVSGSAGDGILRSAADTFSIANGSGGRLAGFTLAPEQTLIAAIGGPNHRYWIDGKNRVGGAEQLEGAPAEPGAWRIEISPMISPRDNPFEPRDTLLLNVLAIGDEGDPFDGLAPRRFAASGDPAAGEAIAIGLPAIGPPGTHARVLVAGADVPRRPLAFARVDLGSLAPRDLAAVGLEPGADYRLLSDGAGVEDLSASDEGVLEVSIYAREIVLGACPAPPRAGQAWRALCAGEAGPTATAAPTGAVTPQATATRDPEGTPPPPEPTGAPLYVPRAAR